MIRNLYLPEQSLQDFQQLLVCLRIFDGNSQRVTPKTAAHRADVAEKQALRPATLDDISSGRSIFRQVA